MDALNVVFFREYTRLDRLCMDAYGTEKGISNYIDLMMETPAVRRGGVRGWDDDIRNLRRLRHIRNQLAHDADAFDEELCTQGDIQWLKSFHSRVLSRNDPLAQLHQTGTYQTTSGYSERTWYSEDVSEKRTGCSAGVFFWAMVLVGLICIAIALTL